MSDPVVFLNEITHLMKSESDIAHKKRIWLYLLHHRARIDSSAADRKSYSKVDSYFR